jgi:hypothetical protein
MKRLAEASFVMVPPARNTLRSIGAVVTSCAGAGGAATIATVHGSTAVALTTFAIMQLWTACEFLTRWQLTLRYARLHDWLVRKAAESPDEKGFRALLEISSRTRPEDSQ